MAMGVSADGPKYKRYCQHLARAIDMAISIIASGKPLVIGMPVEALTQLNGLEDPGVILYGSTLNVPYVGEDAGSAAAGLSPQYSRASVRGSS